MKFQAKRLVETMETSRDRIAVMTFSSPPVGRRKATARANLKVLNSSGSVAKKQLIEDITTLEPGLQGDPAGRDVAAAVDAAVKTLHNMPLDTGRYGSERSGHLFLFTSKLNPDDVQGNIGGVHVHVLGIGPVFTPHVSAGAGGWCTPLAPPLESAPALKRISVDGVEIDVEKPIPKGGMDVKEILRILRMGVDIGVIEDVDLYFQAGDGCRVKAVMGDISFKRLLPGERKSLMVKLEVGNDRNWKDTQSNIGTDLDFDDVERQLQATLGELKSNILTIDAVYRHSHLRVSPTTTIKTVAQVQVTRYIEGSVWSRSANYLEKGVISKKPSPLFSESPEQKRRTFVNAVLVQNLASRHSSARDVRQAVEQLQDGLDAPILLTELNYQAWLEKRYGSSRKTADDGGAAGRPLWVSDTYSGPMMQAFERRFSPDGSEIDRDDNITPRASAGRGPQQYRPSHDVYDDESMHTHSDSELYVIPPSNRHIQRFEDSFNRKESPDEAKRLWMRLGSGYNRFDEGLRSGNHNADDEDGRRNSVGQDTMVTLRDVRETDFSPWVL
jgi:hypothetical protein